MNTALLPLPPRDDLQLSDAELVGITGTNQARLQIEWLKANGWAHATTRAGRPVVGRLYANLKLSGVEVATMITPQEWTPDTGAWSRA